MNYQIIKLQVSCFSVHTKEAWFRIILEPSFVVRHVIILYLCVKCPELTCNRPGPVRIPKLREKLRDDRQLVGVPNVSTETSSIGFIPITHGNCPQGRSLSPGTLICHLHLEIQASSQQRSPTVALAISCKPRAHSSTVPTTAHAGSHQIKLAHL